ncbi:MAG TPA: type II toxin-antitoxin system Phd/YefM family antitoxin [Pseudonocardia sp.]
MALAAGRGMTSPGTTRRRAYPATWRVPSPRAPPDVTRGRSVAAFLVSADQWRSLMETAYLLRSPANAEHLLRSIADAEAGSTETRDLIDPQHDVA